MDLNAKIKPETDICYNDHSLFRDGDCFWTVDMMQVPPAELEGLLVSHPSIADAAVIP